MRKNHECRIDRNKLLTLAIAAIMVSAMAIAIPLRPAAALVEAKPGDPLNLGTGPGSIFYTAHRIPSQYWDPCFATTCDQGSGPGTWMFFVVWLQHDDGTFEEIGTGYANEDGTSINGLDTGKTYYLDATNCLDCNAEGTTQHHDVMFNNWNDCSTSNQMMFEFTLAGTKSAAAYYRYHLLSQPDQQQPCYTTSGGTGTGGTGTGGTQPAAKSRGFMGLNNFELEHMIKRAKAIIGTTTASENGTTKVEASIPSTNLSDVPLGPNRVMIHYNSLYELTSMDSFGFAQASGIADFVGINWDKLSDEQKAYFYLTINYGPETTTIASDNSSIPSTNLSGVPLGPNGVIVHYNSLYDLVNSDSDGVANAIAGFELDGIDWNSLSQEQQMYLLLTTIYGEPQQ